MNGIFRHKSRIYPKKIYITREKNDGSIVKQSITVDQKQMMIPGSRLWNNSHGVRPADMFKCIQPSTDWQSTFVHAGKMGFGSSEYILKEVM